MFVAKLRLALVVVLTLGLVASGAGLLVGQAAGRRPPAGARVADPPAASPAARPGSKVGPAAARASTAAELREALRRRIDFKGFDDPKLTLGEALARLARLYGVTFEINDRAFTADRGDASDDPRKIPITERSPIPPMKGPLEVVLRKILARVPVDSGATYLIHDDEIEITTGAAAREEVGVRPNPLEGVGLGGLVLPNARPQLRLVWETFDDVTLAKALRQLADASGYNLVVDVRVADKAKTVVSARLANVPVDTAVRVLADMADLGVVRLDNLFYVTDRDNAARIRAEEEKRRPTIPPLLGGVAPAKK
jgi:hypothetical protein